MNNISVPVLIASLVGGLCGGALVFFAMERIQETPEARIAEFYETENAVHVSPHGLRKKMTDGKTADFVLVDLRSAEEYEKEHIITAVNVPAYKDPNTSAYDEKERIVSSFKELIEKNPGKEIVVYCYSMPCMTGRKIGAMLAHEGVYVKHLNIGWNEWKYYWNLWNHDAETPVSPKEYVQKGKEPGAMKAKGIPAPCGEGEYGC